MALDKQSYQGRKNKIPYENNNSYQLCMLLFVAKIFLMRKHFTRAQCDIENLQILNVNNSPKLLFYDKWIQCDTNIFHFRIKEV